MLSQIPCEKMCPVALFSSVSGSVMVWENAVTYDVFPPKNHLQVYSLYLGLSTG